MDKRAITGLMNSGIEFLDDKPGCDYCTRRVHIFHFPLDYKFDDNDEVINADNPVRLFIDGNDITLKSDEWITSRQIKYCPFCGRELTII